MKLGTVNQNYRQEINWATDSGGSNWVSTLTGPNLVDQSNGAHGTGEAGVNRATLSASQDVATQITGNNITISAGQDLIAKGTQVIAEAALAAAAGRDISLGTANESASARDQHQHSSSGILTASSTKTDDASSYSNQIGSTFSGNTTVLAAGRDANITGSDVVSTKGTQVTAGNDINIVAATDTSSESHYRKEITSGMMSGGSLGVTVGSKMQSTDFNRNATMASASTVGATDGNVALVAGNHYTQVASNVLAPKGDLSVIAKQIDILAGVNTEQNIQETMFKQQGVTIQVTNPVISAIQAAMSLQESKGKTKSGRSKVLADAATALTLANAAAQVSGSAAPAGGIDLAISMGSSSNQSRTEQNGTTTAASTVASGGTTTIAAVGAGVASNLNIVGSEVTGKDIALIAENQINLIAQRNTNEEHSTNKGSSASVGVSIGTSGLMLNASASGSRGKGDGSDSDYSNTHVTASSQLTMTTGGDATLKGAVVSGQQVIANIGGNLNIESLQDTSSYKSQQQSLGGSVSVGFGKGFSGNISASQSKVDGNYQSVIEQSAINAGDGGFQVNVGGNTDLKGGNIASTDKAVEEGKNQFQTASLTMSDIRNTSEYKAESQSISVGGGYGGGKTSLNGTGVGFANENGSDSSVTTSGISGIAGDTTVRSDKDSSNALVKNWNAKELQADVEAQAKIMEAFGKQAALGIGTYATSKLNELDRQIEKETDPQKKEQLVAEASNWAEGGAYRTALHAAAGALGGGLAGAAGATLSAVSMPAIAEVIGKIDAPEAVKQALEQVAAAALGAAVGGGQGLASAVSVEANNRQLHQTEKDLIKRQAKDKDEEDRLTKAACYIVKCWAEYPEGSAEYASSYLDVMDAYNLKTELAWVKTQQERGLFAYTFPQQWIDYAKNDMRENIAPAAGNSVKVVAGGLSTFSGAALCSTMYGCVPGALMIGFGTSNITEGLTGLYAQYQGSGSTGFNPLKYGFNEALPNGWGDSAYNALDFVSALMAMRARVPLNVGVADGLGRPTSMFGATVPIFNNIRLNPLTKMPLPYGVNQSILLIGAGTKGVATVDSILDRRNK